MKQLLWGVIAIIMGACFWACRKTLDENAERTNVSATEKEITSIKNWLSEQRTSVNAKGVDDFINSLDWSSTDKTSYSGNATLITVKAKSIATPNRVKSYITNANDFTTDYLVIVIDGNATILQGTRGQVTPVDRGHGYHPSVLIKNFLNNTSKDFNGAFTMMTLTKAFLYQFQYEENKRKETIEMRAVKNGSATSASVKLLGSNTTTVKSVLNDAEKRVALNGTEKRVNDDSNCWTYVLWLFDDDWNLIGTIILGVECDEPCALASIDSRGEMSPIRVNCSQSGSGGGGSHYSTIINRIWAVANVNGIGIYKVNTFTIEDDYFITDVGFGALTKSLSDSSHSALEEISATVIVSSRYTEATTYCTAKITFPTDPDHPQTLPGSKTWTTNSILH